MRIIYQFSTPTDCLQWKIKNRHDLICKRPNNCPEILFQGYSGDCPKSLIANVVFKGRDGYLLILQKDDEALTMDQVNFINTLEAHTYASLGRLFRKAYPAYDVELFRAMMYAKFNDRHTFGFQLRFYLKIHGLLITHFEDSQL